MAVKPLTKAELKTLGSLMQRANPQAFYDLGYDINFHSSDETIETSPQEAIKDITSTLAERGNRYGDFFYHAQIAQDLQNCMRSSETNYGLIPGGTPYRAWDYLSSVHRQALTVIADKIARILSGDPSYADNWHDIQGYAKLVEDRLL